jgi:pSer/pThr/pTyr-binding forkhead associated (FHA) protein
MAQLLNLQSQHSTLLRTQHILGRHSGSSNTILDNPEASRLQASILWNGSYWLLQDTSTNGTYINRELITNGFKKRLTKGDSIQFGSLNAEVWLFANDSSPKSLLVPLQPDSQTIELEGVIALPTDEDPEVTIYQSQNGEWICEDLTGTLILQQGSQVSTTNSNWYFVNAEEFDRTKKSETVQNKPPKVEFIFTVSKNEEHVSLSIIIDNEEISLGERTHHYLLLLLARYRIADQQAGVDDGEQGWLDKDLLSKLIGLDENHINIQIYRFRKQLINAKPSAMRLLQLVERRRGCLRLAVATIKINGD